MQALFKERMGGRRVAAGYRFGIRNVMWAAAAQARLRVWAPK